MREKLAQSAFELFAQRGIKNVNLDEIAAHAGVTKGSLYWHYASKKELILAACDYYFRQWRERTDVVVALDDDPLDRFKRAIRASVDSCLFDPTNRVFTSEVMVLALQDPDVLAARAAFFKDVCDYYTRLLEAARAAGQIDLADPREAVEWIIAVIDGIKHRAVLEPDFCTTKNRDRLIDDLMRVAAAVAGPSSKEHLGHP